MATTLQAERKSANGIALNADFTVLASTMALLCIVGWAFMTSASSAIAAAQTGDSWYYAKRQLLSLVIGAAAAWAFSRLHVRIVRAASQLLFAVSVACLVLVLIVGRTVAGQRNWIAMPLGLNFQPSELAKLGLVLMSAFWVRSATRRGKSLAYTVFGLVCFDLVVIGLVLLEGDFGTPLVLAAIAVMILIVAGAPSRMVGSLAGIGLVLVAAVLYLGPGYRLNRIRAWLNPEAYSQDEGYQLLHGKFALADGGWFGRGLGQSTEKWGGLPAPHTDFILPIIGQELGLLGTFAVLIPLFVIIAVAFRIAFRSSDPYERMVAFGIAAWISAQTVLNLASIEQLFPIAGVTLPFVSYGGSSMIPLMAAVGILLGIARHNSLMAAKG